MAMTIFSLNAFPDNDCDMFIPSDPGIGNMIHVAIHIETCSVKRHIYKQLLGRECIMSPHKIVGNYYV